MAQSCCFCFPKFRDLNEEGKSTHLIFLINPKGGGGLGSSIISQLENYENCHIFDILKFAKQGPERQEICDSLLNCLRQFEFVRGVFCGGDGTLTWGFSIFRELKIDIPVAFMPLGTANEIAGCTGWGNSFSISNLKHFVKHAKSRIVVDFDLWDVIYQDEESLSSDFKKPERRPTIMGAFLSFGLDAKVALKFHERRNKRKRQPTVIKSKASYVKYNIEEILDPIKPLNPIIDIYVDGKLIKPLCNYRCVIVLNINSIASGIDFFGNGKSVKKDLLKEGDYTPPKLNDGKVEVILTKSVHNYNLSFLKLKRGIRAAQGSTITFELKSPIFMEVDGEPFINPKGKVVLKSLGKRNIVLGPIYNKKIKKGVIIEK